MMIKGRHLFSSFNKHNTHRVYSTQTRRSQFIAKSCCIFITFVLCLWAQSARCECDYPTLELSAQLYSYSSLLSSFFAGVCASKLNFLFFPVLCNRRSSIMYEFFIINSKLNLKCTKMVFVRFVKKNFSLQTGKSQS